jgi:hypothetical protein
MGEIVGTERGPAVGVMLTAPPIVASPLFIVIASLSVAAPVIWCLWAGEAASTGLDDLKRWLQANSATIMAAVLPVPGVSLTGQGLRGL